MASVTLNYPEYTNFQSPLRENYENVEPIVTHSVQNEEVKSKMENNELYKSYAPNGSCVFNEEIEDFASSIVIFRDSLGLKEEKEGKSVKEERERRVPRGFVKRSDGNIYPDSFFYAFSPSYSNNYHFGTTNNYVTNNYINQPSSSSSKKGKKSKKEDEEEEERQKEEQRRLIIGLIAAISIPVLGYYAGSQISKLVFIRSINKNRKEVDKIVSKVELQPWASNHPHVQMLKQITKDFQSASKSIKTHENISLLGKLVALGGSLLGIAGYYLSDSKFTSFGSLTGLAGITAMLFEYSRYRFYSKQVDDKKISRAASLSEQILATKEAFSFNANTPSFNPELRKIF
eukprot:TRINITY_DN2461_c0_g1_i1.p1 TRINITY_DN2461_c0_g1~~TRINITY_DN2461_c0_g1_i1.p1  ORF type:complete len:345 (-),score=119.63 TRINITY_DN2461_c0_g1_i1:110-1144(-)